MAAYLADGLEPRLPIVVGGLRGTRYATDAVIDTGFSGELTLPMAIIDGLGLTRVGRTDVRLADGSVVKSYAFRGARVGHDGMRRPILVQSAESDSLLGVAFMAGQQLCIEFVDGGKVSLESLE